MRFDPAADSRPTAALMDSQVTHLDGEMPWTSFSSQGGSILLGSGWAPEDGPDGNGQAWVIGTEAELLIPQQSNAAHHWLVMVCRPFTWDGAEPQRILVSVNGAKLGSVELHRGWQEASLDIPTAALEAGTNHVELRFAYATKPVEVGAGKDRRDLSACFREIRLQPSPAEDSRSSPAEIEAPGRLRITQNGSIDLPLPPQSLLTWNLKILDSRTTDLQGIVRFRDARGRVEPVWQGLLGGEGDHMIEVTNSLEMCGLVSLELTGEDPRSGDVHLAWGEDQFRLLGKTRQFSTPHVFIYVVDALRANALELYGAQRPLSPHLKQFAQDSVVYEHAVAASTWTLPSVVSLLTGVYPERHGVMKGDVKLSTETGIETLPALLGKHGYMTLGLSQSFVVGPQFGVDKGFDEFRLMNRLNSYALRTGEIRRSLVSWLEHEYGWDQPMFVYIHAVGPHAPYNPPERYGSYARSIGGKLERTEYIPAHFQSGNHGNDPAELGHLRSLYDGEVQYADEQFGLFIDLLKYFGLYDNSMIIFLADHGEEFADHGGYDHGRTLYEEVARIPLVVKYPGQSTSRGSRTRQGVSEVDILPTILHEAGITIPAGLPGNPLPPNERADGGRSRPIFSQLNPVASETYESVDYRAIWLDGLKCIENLKAADRFGRFEKPVQAFDLVNDPGERTPLTDDDPRVEVCARLLANWESMTSSSDNAIQQNKVTDQTQEMLRALGYVK